MRGYSDPKQAWGQCLISASRYSKRHRWGLVQVTGLTYPGREHWASAQFTWRDDYTDATVVDLTMRQFDPTRPAEWQGTLDDWLDDMVECLRDDLRYALYASTMNEEPVFTDTWVREDMKPGDMWSPFSD